MVWFLYISELQPSFFPLTPLYSFFFFLTICVIRFVSLSASNKVGAVHFKLRRFNDSPSLTVKLVYIKGAGQTFLKIPQDTLGGNVHSTQRKICIVSQLSYELHSRNETLYSTLLWLYAE